jgi:hypothetical protein
MTKPRAACPAGRTDAAESASSHPRPSPIGARSRVARVRWHAHVCRVAALIHPLSSSPPRQWRTDKRPLRRLHARPLPLRRRRCALLRAQAR